MPSLADSAVIFILALMLFGPKKLPQLARQLGKLMAEFRRASNEFRMQMEDELRVEEQKEHQAKVEAMAGPPSEVAEPGSPEADAANADADGHVAQPIAQAGELKMMPPSTGLPVESGNHGTSPRVEEAPIAEPTILPPSYGSSSEEPVADAQAHTEGEHATHA